MWHLTPDTGHMTPDTWPVTCDMWHMHYEDISTKDDLITDEGVCRTAPATPGLFKIYIKLI